MYSAPSASSGIGQAVVFFHVLHLGLHGGQLDAHGAADGDGAVDRALDADRRVAGGGHALAELAHHVDDVVAHRADRRAASAQGAGVVDQFLPFAQFGVGHRLGQAHHLLETAQQGVFLLVDPAQGFQLVNGGVLGIAGFRIEQAGLGADAAVHATVEIAGDGGVDDLLEDPDAFIHCGAHTATPL